jgi:hypothetical protein
MAIPNRDCDVFYNPWFKVMFTGEIFLLDSYTIDQSGTDVIGVKLIGISSSFKKKLFELKIPNMSKLKIELHMGSNSTIIL